MSDQHLIGTEGDDFLQAAEGNDWLEGLGGNDVLLGGAGDDLYMPGAGADFISDFSGFDELRFAPGVSPNQVERIRLSGSYDLILRVAGTDEQVTIGGWFYDPSNQIERVTFDDGTVWDAAQTSSLRRLGAAGDDFIQGTEYDERLEGRGGNDVLLGGAGNDVYVPDFGGNDWINDFAGDDELRLNGVSPDQIERIRQSGSYDLVLRVAATGDQVTLGGWFYDPSNQIERVVFDDGTVWEAAETSSLRRFGTAGDDFIQGTEYDERLEGRGGNDVLLGGAGNDVYVPGFGGNDWVNDFAGDDELRLDGVSPDQVERIRQPGSYDLVLRVAATGDQLTLGGWFYDAANQIERVVFDDETVWNAAEAGSLRRFGTAGDDFIQGTEYDERLEGRGGNDVLLGGAGNDVYVPGFGGSDWVNDFDGYDELRLDGVSPYDVERIRPSGSYDLVLRVAGTGDQVTLGGWFYDPSNEIERVVFDDGTVWEPWSTSVLWRIGTAGDDFLQGNEYNEAIEGRGGNDVLLAGGGSDFLIGGDGNDFYVPVIGGQDRVFDFLGDDELRLAGVSPDQIERIRELNSTSLVFRIAGTTDQVTLESWFSGAQYQIERVVFDDGTVWDPATSSTLGQGSGSNHAPTVTNPIADQIGGENAAFNLVVPSGTFEDPDTGDTLTLSARLVGGDPLPDWLLFDPATGTFSGTPPFGTAGTVTVELLATDSGGLSAADQFNIAIAYGFHEIYGTEGNDLIMGFPGPDLIWAGGGDDEVWGLEGDDAIYADYTATPGNDTVYGGAGSDFIYGGGGTDLLVGGTGNDSYEFLSGSTVVVEYADEGFDQVGVTDSYVLPANVENLRLLGSAVYGTGNDLANLILGTSGDNRIDGGAGADNMQGSTGNDTYVVDHTGDLVFESTAAGVDTIESSITYTLGTNVENLVLTGAAAINGTGNGWNNVLTGNSAANVLTGGINNDTYVIDPADTIVELFNEGNDTVVTASSYTLGANLENLTLTGAAAIDGTGNGGVNVIRGNSAANTLRGEFDNDWLYGNEGDDVLDGGLGHDTMHGGAGDDLYYYDFGSDIAIEAAGEGIDTVISTIGIDLSANVENLVVIADIAGYGGGNALDNIITGSAVGDFLVGYAGNDTLYGGAGYDWLRGYDGDDSLYGQADIDDLFGFTGNDYLDGGEGNDRLDGGAGDDTMAGGTGDDLYIVDDAGDVVVEVAGEGVDTVESSMTSYQLGEHVENLTLVGEAASGIGNDAANVIIGNDAPNTIGGRGGDDILIGGGGNDYIVDYEAGNDQLIGGAGSDFMIGLEGDDIYDPGFGGQDTVYDTGGDDEVRMGPGISPDQVERIREGHLVLRIAGTTESVTLYNWFSDPSWQIERVVFDDGTVWDAATTAALRYLGTAGDDVLQGSWYGELIDARDGNDQISGSYGSDTLAGGRGSDTYLFDWLAGDVDTVRESQADFFDIDTLRFVIWITPDDLVVTRDGLDLQVAIAGQDAAVRFEGWFDPAISSHVERFEFQDGAIVISDWVVEQMINDAPVVANPLPDRIAAEDAVFSLSLPADTFADPDPYDSLTYTASLADGSALPSWLSFNSGTFSGTPANGDVGTISVQVTATDEQGLSASDVFVLMVTNTNDAPTLANLIADQNAIEDTPFSLALAADTFADVDAGDTLSYSATRADGSALPAWLAFNAGTFSGTPANGDVGTLSLRITATDLGGFTASDVFNITVANTNDAPTLATPIPDQGAAEDLPFSFVVAAGTFADVDTGDTLTYATDPLPVWLSFDGATRTFSGTPGNGDVGTVLVRITATDGSGASAAEEFAIAVANTNDAPTLANPIADQGATEDAAFSFTVAANAFADIDVGDFLDYAATLADGSALPAWLMFDPGTRAFSGTPVNGDVGTISVRITASDAGGASAADVFGIAVANTNDAPTLASPVADQSAQDTVGFSFTVPAGTFADVDAGDSLTYATGALPSWLSFNAATRTFSGTPGSAHLGVVSIQVIATDSAGAQMSDAFNITVGAAPNQTITGTAGNDTLNGASGNDTINGLGGADAMAGGLGNDAYFVDNAGDQVIEAAGAGDDTVNASISHTLGANVENLVLTGTSNINAAGNSLDNWLTGNSGKNTLAGGAGNDTYVVTQNNDSVVENAGNGADTVRASITYTLGSNVESLVLTGTAAINGTGNTADNWLTGNAGNNILRGQGGADSLNGGAGNDTLTGGSGLDTFWFLGAPGTANADHITDFGSGERLYLEDLVHPGIGAEGNFAPNDARFFAAPGASGGADASDRVIYDTATGRLYFDADGNGAAAPSLVATLDNLFALSASNITVI